MTRDQIIDTIRKAVGDAAPLGTWNEEHAIAYAAHLATQPGIISATFNQATASIDLVVEPEPLGEISIDFTMTGEP